MSKVSDDILDGYCCFKCRVYFESAHGHPVLCSKCWTQATPEEQAKGKEASHPIRDWDKRLEAEKAKAGTQVEEPEEEPAEETPEINTHHLMMDFGKYVGERVTRVPVGYLKWAIGIRVDRPVNTSNGVFPFWKVAQAEVKRRGARIEQIEISAHALDRLSVRYWKKWMDSRGADDVGIYTWAQKIALTAWKSHMAKCGDRKEAVHDDQVVIHEIDFGGIVWVIEELAIPVVKTVK